jgi:hypothetical protein
MAAGIPGRTSYAWRQILKHLRATATHCAKCGGEIDMTLRWPDPMSMTGGHILPWAHYPEHRDDPDNAQAEHLRCNVSEGDAIARGKQTPPHISHTNSRW